MYTEVCTLGTSPPPHLGLKFHIILKNTTFPIRFRDQLQCTGKMFWRANLTGKLYIIISVAATYYYYY